jgi:exopolyphosphatase/guanosine-5'-triphosphate,3'-diphosphate pyrophosphatase
MRIAAIDIGSNSIHMVIAEGKRSGAFHVLDSEKDMIRLGAGTLRSGRLSALAIRRGLEVLRDYRRLAETHRVDKIVAVATSAVREAGNGEEFLDRVSREIGIRARAISGEQEAHLVYLAARHSINLEGRRALVVDIGGGSVELAVGTGGALEIGVSERIGILRLAERFLRSDPLSGRDRRRMEKYIGKVLDPHVKRIRAAGFESVVGTSGTILALGDLAHLARTGRRMETLHHLTVPADSLRVLSERLAATSLRQRLRMPGLDPARADVIVAGAILLDQILTRLRVKELVLSEWALREGILLNYILGHPRTLERAEAYPDVRRRSVVELAERFQYDEPHCRQVASLALALFDGTRRRHGLDGQARALLEHASWLHDIGHRISHLRHHRHSYYLIKNGGLRGFTPMEIEIIANVARYHSQGRPRKKHAAYAALPAAARRTVRVLAGCLRLAEALDRGHRQRVETLTVSPRGPRLTVRLASARDVDLELWGGGRRTELLEKALGTTIRFARSGGETPAPRRREGRS